MSTNIRLGSKLLPVTNFLTYWSGALVTKQIGVKYWHLEL